MSTTSEHPSNIEAYHAFLETNEGKALAPGVWLVFSRGALVAQGEDKVTVIKTARKANTEKLPLFITQARPDEVDEFVDIPTPFSVED
jgi:hypothetical protein